MGRLGRIAAAAVVLAVLSGCSAIEDIGRTGESIAKGAAIDAALGEAKEQLEAIDGAGFLEG